MAPENARGFAASGQGACGSGRGRPPWRARRLREPRGEERESQRYETTISYVGHADTWDAVEIEGVLGSAGCVVRYKRGNRTLAVATISRDLQSLEAEVVMES